MGHNLETGRKGESIALSYLEKNSYRILQKNWHFLHKEVDIIALDKDCLVIVEVKTRTGAAYIDPIERVTLKKQSFLITAAEEYLYLNHLDMNVRFDVICIKLDAGHTKLEHIKNAFHPIAH